jgi:hypothetical protein
MKTRSIYISSLLILLLLGCKNDTEKPKVIYEDVKKVVAPKKDTTQIKIADLPIHLQGTNFLIHPIGDYRINEGRSKTNYSSGYEEGSFTISNTSDFEITGFLSDLKFQEIGTDSLISISDKPILIQRATYLKTRSENPKHKILVYVLSDSDTNKDGKLDSNDIQSLYVSQMGGKNFTKLSSELRELLDWNFIEVQNRLYFRTIEDNNKNGEFDKNDKLHYQYTNILDNNWEVIEYKPL